ncbi:MAG: zinc-binding dehydrogenase [Halobacteriaceae archaeon]
MLAARYHGEGDLRLEEVPEPAVDADEVLVDVEAASLCGSDVNYLKGKTDPGNAPITLGHEGAGVVRATGDGVDSVSEGDRVVVHYIRSCGTCSPCIRGDDNQCRNRQSIGHHVDGTFAEAIAVPERSCIALPEGVPFAQGSVAGCAASTGYHAVSHAEVGPGDSAVVFGAGGVGLHAILWADFFGASDVLAVDINDEQLEVASRFGADVTANPTSGDVLDVVADVTDGWGADAAIECSGSPAAIQQALDAVNGENGYESGRVVSVGIQTEAFEVEFGDVREGKLTVSGDHTRADLEEILTVLSSGDVDLGPSITHRYALEDIEDAVAAFNDPDEQLIRAAIEP